MRGSDDFFHSRIDQMIDLRHPLAVAREVKQGRSTHEVGLFGSQTAIVGGGVSKAGRPRLPFRLMVSLLYLKHAFNESDEGLVERWSETPTWQYFSGMDYFEHRAPCDPTLIGKFRKLIGEEGVEELLAKTISVAVNLKLISKKSLETVVVDSTVQPKARQAWHSNKPLPKKARR
ncbi:MAG: transposase [Betaproteobacteria bacterium]|nr:transposase [Betaproteobacteria bacterium]